MRELAAVEAPNESCSEQQGDAGGTTVELQVEQLAVGQQWTAGGAIVGQQWAGGKAAARGDNNV